MKLQKKYSYGILKIIFFIYVLHIPGKHNTEAEKFSRTANRKAVNAFVTD